MKPEELRQYDEAAKQPIEVGDRVWVGDAYQFAGKVVALSSTYAIIVKPGTHLHVDMPVGGLIRLPDFGDQDGTDQS